MLPSERVKLATQELMRKMQPINHDIAQKVREQIIEPPKMAGRQLTFKNQVLDRIIKLHDTIANGETLSDEDAGFLVLTCFNAAAEIQKLQENIDRIAGHVYKQTIEKISLAGR